jgi:hypothetical protein
MSDQPEHSPKKEKPTEKGAARQDGRSARTGDVNVLFDLENRYPDVGDLFAPNLVSSTDRQDVMVSIDTNALLLPYGVGIGDLKAIADVYRRLAKEQRLFLSARAAREFIKHRDRKLVEMIKALDGNFRVAAPTMLDGLSGYKDLRDALKKVQDAYKQYDKAKTTVVAGIRGWRGNDPVSELYREVFTKDKIIEHDGEAANVAEEWEARQSSQMPPGYKDAHKEDSGIGDFLIWKSILRLGESRKQDLVFVTGERKSDWFVRSDGEPVYPRPELVHEYKRFSKGRNFRLATLADLLRELDAPEKVVQDVREAEVKASVPVQIGGVTANLHTSIAAPIFNTGALLQGYPGVFNSGAFNAGTTAPTPAIGILVLCVPNIDPTLYNGVVLNYMSGLPIVPIAQVKSFSEPPGNLYLAYDSSLSAEHSSAILNYARVKFPDTYWVPPTVAGNTRWYY